MARIRLSPSASVTPTAVGVVVRSDLGIFQLEGRDVSRFLTEMLPLLDGTHDPEAVAAEMSGYSAESVLAFLQVLKQQGLLETVPENQDTSWEERWRGQNEFLQKWTDQPDEARRRLTDARILMVGLEPWGTVAAAELAASGIGALHLLDDGDVAADDLLSAPMWSSRHLGHARRDALTEALAEDAPWCTVTAEKLIVGPDRPFNLDDSSWDLIIAGATADDLLLLHGLARYAHDTGIAYLSGHLDGLDAVVGPVVIPGKTACWNCWRLRRLANADHLETAHAVQATLLTQRPSARTLTYLTPMPSMLGHLLALEALKLISHYTPSNLVGRVLVQNLVTLETTTHTIVRMPWCEVCGGAGGSGTPPGDPAPLGKPETSGEQSKRLDEAGDPESLRQRLSGWVDDRTGVIRYLQVGVPDAREPELPIVTMALQGAYTEGTYQPEVAVPVASGKGLSSTEAMIGAAGEAIERYSAGRYRTADLHRSSLNALEGDRLDPRQLCLYSDAQYDEPDFPYSRFDPNRPIYWTRGRWLDSTQPVWLPALPTYLRADYPAEEQFCQVTSNGLAAGSNVEDATMRATCELVERDAGMLTWLCCRSGRMLVLDETLDVNVREVIRQFEERGPKVELYLLDAGTPIPVVASMCLGDGKNWPAAVVALAAHPSPRTAVRKSILELGAVAPHIRRLMLSEERPIPARPEDVHTLDDHALYYVPIDRLPIFDFLRRTSPPVRLATLEEPQEVSLEDCVKRLHRARLRVAVADVTSPDVATGPLRVVRALGVHMQPIDFGFRFRRLANPRLQAMLTGAVNPHPHPLA